MDSAMKSALFGLFVVFAMGGGIYGAIRTGSPERRTKNDTLRTNYYRFAGCVTWFPTQHMVFKLIKELKVVGER